MTSKNYLRLLPDEERFWLQVDKKGPDECWEWIGSRSGTQRYALFHVNGHQQSAHRYSYELFYGPIEPGLHILHRCDNGFCVNPNHLWQGTATDNMRDCSHKGRGNHVRGEHHGMSKLKEQEVSVIKGLILKGVCLSDIARKYGVDLCTISDIKSNRHWKWVETLRQEPEPSSIPFHA